MRCEEARRIIEEEWPEELSGPLGEHLAHCPACKELGRQTRLLVAGFRALACAAAPEPSWGFASRVVRRLEDSGGQAAAVEEFFLRVGRRVVYATCVLAVALLLALAVPASGPLRGPATAEVYFAQAERALAGNEPVFLGEYLENDHASPAPPNKEENRSKP